MQITLNTRQLYIPQPAPSPLNVQLAKPLSYDFRVAEHLDKDNNVERVGLQVQVYEHDEFGSGTIRMGWQDVPRVKLKDGVIWVAPITP